MCTMFEEIEIIESYGTFLRLIEYHQFVMFGFLPKFMKPLKESQNRDTMVIFELNNDNFNFPEINDKFCNNLFPDRAVSNHNRAT